ncbi:arginase family protein [Kribbella solani]|uniref:Arginase n=1 Tax=Kribbella solani TaxID=236067 RepID=A0A841DHT6_9ACTN|nr:arginase family protein [Kribbella solani]MBB5977049.1 arginase [Kribbella solani]
MAGAVRDLGFVGRIGAADGGYVTPPRYDRGGWKPGDGVFNAGAIAAYTTRLADRIERFVDQGKFVVVLGGECSNLLAPAVALKRRGRYGVVYLDGHSDFRTVDNSPYVGAAGGEALALVTGRGQADLTDLEGLRPYVRDSDAVLLGIRADDDYAAEVQGVGIPVWTAARVAADPAGAAHETLNHVGVAEPGALDAREQGGAGEAESGGVDGFWVHLDVDILDAALMPAVDSPDPGGIDHEQLRALLRPLLRAPGCVGIDIGIFDPDLDPDGKYAVELTDTLVAVLS